ncbi:BMP family protein [Oscillospiraceae bacterium PP1C4]
MKKNFKAATTVLLSTLMIAASFAGCGAPKSPESSSAPAETASAGAVTEKPSSTIRVAQVLEGPISDMNWNTTAYNGLKKIEALGAEISYQENVPSAAVADSVRTYASEGYNVIYMTTNTYQDAGLEVSKDFPDIQFLICNGSQTTENFHAFQIADEEQGFMMGVISALLTKTNKVGFVGGSEIAPIIKGGKGFAQGVAYVNKDLGKNVEVVSAMTGNFEDVNKAKETATAMIEAGVDVLAPMANQASSGVMQAAEEAKIMAVASGAGQETIAPNAEKVAVFKDTSIAYEATYQMFLAGKLPNEVIKMGAKDGVVHLSDWFGEVPEDVKTKAVEIMTKLGAGEITIDLT